MQIKHLLKFYKRNNRKHKLFINNHNKYKKKQINYFKKLMNQKLK